ncbi:4Fe-4S binding protein [Moorella naiadis]
MTLDEDKCRSCGYCVSLCRHGALTSDRLAGPA